MVSVQTERAYHEAGHSAMAFYLGREIKTVSLRAGYMTVNGKKHRIYGCCEVAVPACWSVAARSQVRAMNDRHRGKRKGTRLNRKDSLWYFRLTQSRRQADHEHVRILTAGDVAVLI